MIGDNYTPQPSAKLYRRVFDDIVRKIASGTYEVGGRLPSERDLSEQFGVSRPTIREAITALEMQGLVQPRFGSGVYVMAKPGNGGLPELDIGAFELMEARRLFEAETAALAAAAITDEQLAKLAELTRQMEEPTDMVAEAADREFHLVIAQATGNGAIIATITYLWDVRYRAPLAKRVLTRVRGLGQASRIAEHHRVLDALRQRDPSAARLAMRDHLDRVVQHLLEVTELDEVEEVHRRNTEKREQLAKRTV